MELRYIFSLLMGNFVITFGLSMKTDAGFQTAVVPKYASRDEAEQNIPVVPSESRAQYYVKNDDGTFTYGYDTGSGMYEMATKTGVNDVKGFYGFTYPDGRATKVSYIAGGERGFVPTIEEISHDRSTSDSGTLFPKQNFGLKSDSSYSFSYENERSARSETADADHNVRGSYSFIADDGIRRTVNYKAGSDTGFVVDADFIPSEEKIPALRRPSAYSIQPVPRYVLKEKSHNASEDLKPDGSYNFQYRNADSSRKETADRDLNVEGEYSFIADDGIRRTVYYKARSDTGFVVDADFIPSEEKTPALRRPSTYRSQPVSRYVSKDKSHNDSEDSKPDGSYSFQYRNADSSRKETADRDLNVEGEYSFIADDGIRRTVNYKAGSDTGFVVDADFIPSEQKIPSLRHPSTYSILPVPRHVSKDKSHNDSEDLKPDGSYSFQYRNSDSSRKETADRDLNVEGEYSFIADDGIRRTVNYRAGSDTGFIVDADFIPSAEKIPARKFKSTYSIQPVPRYVSRDEGQSLKSDGSNSFQYKTVDSSRKVTADVPSTQQIPSHTQTSTFVANPVFKNDQLNDEHIEDYSKLSDKDRAYHITKDRSRKEIVNADFKSRNEYSFIDYHGVKKVDSDVRILDNLFTPKATSPLRSARDFQIFKTHADKEEHLYSGNKERTSDSNIYPDIELATPKQSGGQIFSPSNKSNSNTTSLSTKYLVGNVWLKKYPERGYVFTVA